MSKNSFLENPIDAVINEISGQTKRITPNLQDVAEPAVVDVSVGERPTTNRIKRHAKTPDFTPPANIRPIFDRSAAKYGVPVEVLLALGHQESRFNPQAVGTETEYGRAKGIMQYLDSTAKGMGINPFDPVQSVDAAAKQLRERLDKGYTMDEAVKAHFAGDNRKKWGEKTAAYGKEVLGKAARLQGSVPAPATAEAAEVPLTMGELQKKLDTDEPGRFKVLTPEQVQTKFSPTTMSREAYERAYMEVNPEADQAARVNAMQEYDKQQAAAAQAKITEANRKIEILKSPGGKFNQAFQDLKARPDDRFLKALDDRLRGPSIGQRKEDIRDGQRDFANLPPIAGKHPASEGIIPPLPAFKTGEQKPAYDGSNDFMRRFEGAAQQGLGLVQGTLGAVGDVSQRNVGFGEGLRDWGYRKYKENMQAVASDAKEQDDFVNVVGAVKDGNFAPLVDYLQGGAGYLSGQLVETLGVSLAAAGVGAAAGAVAGGVGAAPGGLAGGIGGVVAKGAAKTLAKGFIEKQMAKFAAEGLAKGLTTEAAEIYAKQRLGSAVARQLSANALFNVSQSVGSTYGGARDEKNGAQLSAGELTKAIGFGSAAAATETVGNALGLGSFLSKSAVPAAGVAAYIGYVAKKAGVNFGLESSQELVQTVLERMGSGSSLADEKALNDYINSAVLGGLGGAARGAAGGAVSGVDALKSTDRLVGEAMNADVDATTLTAPDGSRAFDPNPGGVDPSMTRKPVEHVAAEPAAPEQSAAPPKGPLAKARDRVIPVNPAQDSLSSKLEAGLAAGTVQDLSEPSDGTPVTWRNADNDVPVELVGIEDQPGSDGRTYARVRRDGVESFVPADELFNGETPVVAAKKEKANDLPVRDDSAASPAEAAPAAPDQPAGRAPAEEPAAAPEAAPAVADASDTASVPDADKPADDKPALKAPDVTLTDEGKNPHAGKWFSSQEKADAYMAKKEVGDDFEVVKTGKVRFEVKPKTKAKADAVTQPEPAPKAAEKDQAPEEKKPAAKRFPKVTETDYVAVGPSGIRPRLIAEGKALHRETNAGGLDSILRGDNSFDVHPIFVSDNPDLSIGQGDNKGIRLVFRPDSLSGAENVKPGTGDIAGREYQVDVVAPRAIQSVEIAKGTRLADLSGLARNILVRDFTKTERPDGTRVYRRNGLETESIADSFTSPADQSHARLAADAHAIAPAKVEQILSDPNTGTAAEAKQFKEIIDGKENATSPADAANAKGKEPVAADPGQADKQEANADRPVGDSGNARVKRATVSTPAGRDIDVDYKVVEADSLITSNDDMGAINPAYPQELQPRDRTRASSEIQINDIASKMNPRLLGEGPSATDGAPIVSNAGVVESGNGRTLAIKRAYSRDLPTAKAYREWLTEQGHDISGMKNPVLVRERVTPMTTKDLQDYTLEANQRTTMEMAPAERAVADAKSLGPIVSEFKGGDIASAGNRDFVRKFVRDVVSKGDQAGMMDEGGSLSQAGRRRVEAALVAAAYGDSAIIADLFESVDSDIKSIGGALLDVSGQWAQMREEARAGSIAKDVDITANLMEAVNMVRRARSEGRPISELVKQTDIFAGEVDPVTVDFLRIFYRGDNMVRARSRDAVADALQHYADAARKTVPGDNLFGDPAPTGADIMRNTNDRIQRQETDRAGQQQDIFSSPKPDAADAGSPGGQGQGSRPEKGSEPAQEGVKPEAKDPAYGSKNKLVTAGRAAELRDRLKKKLNGSQLNSGIDPEVLAIGTELAVFHLEAGARKFADFAKAIAADLDEPLSKLKPYLRGFYNGARDMMEDAGLDVAGMDDSNEVRSAMESLFAEKVAEPKTGSLLDHFSAELAKGNMPKDNNALRKMVAEFDGAPADNVRLKQAQEDLEAAIVVESRKVAGKGWDARKTYDELVLLYNSQPNLNIRTSTSMENQAYSTPAPLAYVSAQLAGIDATTAVYEPTAGNGMLLITANPAKATANELDDQRYANLKAQGFDAIQGDALEAVSSGAVRRNSQDAIITNPPFGGLKDAAGAVKKVDVDGYKIGKIDHLIAAEALSAMKDDGKAVLILGADKVAGGVSKDDRIFMNWLYSHYNVTHQFEADGKLYTRQGAGWPVRVIAINGRVASDKVGPREGTIQRVNTWEQVYEQYEQGLVSQNAGIDRNAAGSTNGAVQRGAAGNDGANASGTAGAKTDGGSVAGRASGKTGTGNVSGQRAGTAGNTGVQPAEGVGASTGQQRRDEPADSQDQLADGSKGRDADAKAGTNRPDGAAGTDRVTADPENAFQSVYVPASSRKDEGVLIPVNMAGPLSDALATVQDEVGDIDAYAAKELGYGSTKQLHDALMGLQVDSVATAIRNLKGGKGTVIADQTGIGKGRQAAAVIRWAVRNNYVPVFITVKPELFTDMYGDLADIGTDDVSPLILNSEEYISGEGREKLFANKKSQHGKTLADIAATGSLPEGRNAVFMTYSQINKDNVQRRAIASLAGRVVFVLDESHNAGGQSSTGEYVRSILDGAPGVVYLSATYAKRPDNMPVYFRTDIGEAISDESALSEAMAMGGLPLQTVVSNNLVKAGQMFRRERSYDGVDITTKVDAARSDEHEALSDKVTGALRAIVAADKAFHKNYFVELKKQMEAEGKDAFDVAGNQASESVNHTEFSSVVHNFVRQLLLGLKADAAADEAIAALKRGEKPLIALDNTMGSFLSEYAANAGIKPGSALGNFDYRTVLSRALERSRAIKFDDGKGNSEKRNIPLSELDSITRAAYDAAQKEIDGLDVQDVPVSPIDWIRHRLEKAGHTVAEITGRDLAVDYSGKVPMLANVPSEEQNDKVATTRRFNSGQLDAIILNVSGSTGISLHASERFTDQRPRHMIVAQAAQDINIFMQMLGRIHRTGQVKLPSYTILNVDLPAEKRPTAILSKKMKSLNANTSSNTESATSVKAVDMLNKYGDQIVGQYLADNEELADQLSLEGSTTDKDASEDIARKATGRLALMPVAVQKQFYAEIEEQYTAMIDYLNKTNQNELEPRTFDFEARETRRELLVQESGSSPFQQAADYVEFSIKAQGKSMTPDEIIAEKNKNLEGKAPNEHAEALIRSLTPAFEKFAAKLDGETISKAMAASQAGTEFIREHKIGSGWRVEINGEIYNAVVTNLKNTHKSAGNPFSLSKTNVTLAVNGSLRHVTVPATQFEKILIAPMWVSDSSLDGMFRAPPANERESAKLITGNLLAAYGEIRGTHGTIVNFSREDGTIEQGILLPKKFDFTKNTAGDYRLKSGADAYKFLMNSRSEGVDKIGIRSRDGVVSVVADGSGIEIRVPKSKAKGGKYFLDAGLRAAMGDFTSSGPFMIATVGKAKAAAAIDALQKKTSLYTMPSMSKEARQILGDELTPIPPTTPTPGTKFSASKEAPTTPPSELRTAITSGPEGAFIASLIESGDVILHDTQADFPGNAPTAIKGATTPDGKVHLIGENLTPETAKAVLFHEMFHRGGEKLLGGKEWAVLKSRLGQLYRQAAGSSSDSKFMRGVRARLDDAVKRGAVLPANLNEEFGAYLIEEYENAPSAYRSWVDDFIGRVKAYLLQKFGAQIGKVTPGQLRAIAVAALKAEAGPVEGEKYSGAKQTETAAFKKWFGDSKVVDANGEPLVVYHGTGADIQQFDTERAKQSKTAEITGVAGFFFAPSADVASDYSFGKQGANVVPAYLSINNPAEVPYGQFIGGTFSTDSLIKDGHDGMVIRRGNKPWSYVAFYPEQIKSATGNTGAFDPANPDIRFSAAGSTTGIPLEEQSRLRKLRVLVQDSMDRVKQIQKSIEEVAGSAIGEQSDFYAAVRRMPGRVATLMEDAKSDLTGPLMRDLAKMEKTQAQLSELLQAQHAEEANAHLATINPLHNPASPEYIGTQGSGMNDDDARVILDRYANDADFLALADRAREISRKTLDMKFAYGLITEQLHDHLSNFYQYYVPLKGDVQSGGKGKGGGAKMRRRTGHVGRDEKILENIALDFDKTVKLGEVNLSRQHLASLIIDNPDPEVWTIGVIPGGKRVAESSSYNVEYHGSPVDSFRTLNEARAYIDGLGGGADYTITTDRGEKVVGYAKPLQDNEVTVFIDGVEARIQLNDEALAEYAKVFSPGMGETVFEAMRTMNRYFSKIYTGYNPAFIFKNAMRDAITGTINILGNYGAVTAASAWGHYPAAAKAMLQFASTKKIPSGDTGTFLREYRAQGGKVGASWLADLEQQGESLTSIYEDAYGVGRYVRDGRLTKAGVVALRKSVLGMAHIVEIANQAAENSLRLGLFIALRKQGSTPAEAAMAAKTVTVDFDRKGSATGAMSAFYLFINPAIQGTANAAHTVFYGAKKEQAWMALGSLTALGLWVGLTGMDDDKERWLGESWGTRTKNVVMNLGGKRIQIPLSQEFSPFYAVGVAAAEAMRGESAIKSTVRTMSSFLNAYFPLKIVDPDSSKPGETFILGAMPTAIKPAVELGFNRNSFGSEIVPENKFNQNAPDNQKMNRVTKGSLYDEFAQLIAKGGENVGYANRYENDLTKVSPEAVKYLWRTYTGGLGAFVTDTVGTAAMAVTDPDAVEQGDIPIAKDFVKPTDVRPLRSRFYDLADEAEAAASQFSEARKAGDREELDRLRADDYLRKLNSTTKLLKAYRKRAAAKRDEMERINGDDSLTVGQKRAQVRELEQREEQVYRAGIKAFMSRTEPDDEP